jgi:hypothetical protein
LYETKGETKNYKKKTHLKQKLVIEDKTKIKMSYWQDLFKMEKYGKLPQLWWCSHKA